MTSPRDAMRVLLVSNTGWYLYNFRRGLIAELRARGLAVAAVCPRDGYVEKLEEAGVRWIEWKLDRSGMRPWREVGAIRSLRDIYRNEHPDLVHHFTIKSILYGTAAARLAGVPRVVNSVTGLGHAFVGERLASQLLRPLLRRWYVWSLSTHGVRPIFQNADDLEYLSRWAPGLRSSAVYTRGSGIDLKRFSPLSENRRFPGTASRGLVGEGTSGEEDPTCILFAGRLLKEKGIDEFVEAARLCRNRGLRARFVICGAPDPGNPSSLDEAALHALGREELFDLRGHVDPIDPALAEADIVVLPSYREGTPRVLLEAAAMAKPVIASDVPGCREVVSHDVNGLLVPPRDAASLAAAIERLSSDAGRRREMGERGRERMVADFDERAVIETTISAYGRTTASVGETPRGATPLVPRERRGVLTLSLDFELAWGTRGRRPLKELAPFLAGTRQAIRSLLRLCEVHDVPATWAIVGALLLGKSENSGRHSWLSEPEFNDVPAGDAHSQPFWYAEDMLEEIRGCDVQQEIACHTLTHRFVDPGPAGRAAFRAELERFRQLFDEHFLPQPRTFIYPKARMGHFDVLAEMGFRCYRGPENKWFESLPASGLRGAARLLDGRWGRPPVVEHPRRDASGLWIIPSSQFYAPFLRVGRYVSVEARVAKAVKGLRLAAETGGIFHLWTHPFNLGVRTEELMQGLDTIFREAVWLRDQGRLDILPMGAIAERLDAPTTPQTATLSRT